MMASKKWSELRPELLSMSPGRVRIDWIDAARGIAIVLVVFDHVLAGLVPAGIWRPSHGFDYTNYLLYTFHVPVFFLIVGINAGRSLEGGRKRFVLNKLWQVGYAYIIWSLIQGNVEIALAKQVNHPMIGRSLGTIAWKPIGQFWFLYALLVCHLIAAVFVPRHRFLLLVFGAAWFGLGMHVAWDFGGGGIHMILFYALGVVLSDRIKEWKVSWGFTSAGFCLGIWAIVFAGSYAALRDGVPIYSWWVLPVTLAGIAGTIWVAKSLHGWVASLMVISGRHSMSIYVMHVLAAAGFRIVCIAVHIRQPVLHLVGGTLLGVVLPILAERIFESLNLRVFLGLCLPVFLRDRSQPHAGASIAIPVGHQQAHF
jgi:surface polysaccharide O-acyltransferase-like enzyme